MAVKRKSADTPVKSKKAKKQDTISLDQIKTLTRELDDDSNKKLNNIAILLSYYNELQPLQDDDIVKLRSLTLSLQSIFEKLMKRGVLSLKKDYDESMVQITKWLKLKYSTYIDQILTYLKGNGESESTTELFDSFQIDILEILLRLVKLESKWFSPNIEDPFFSLPIYKKLISKLLFIGEISDIGTNGINNSNFLLLEFCDNYLSKYWDLKYYFINEVYPIIESTESLAESKKQIFFANYLLIFKKSIYTNYEKDSAILFTSNPPQKQISKLNTFKSNFEKNWLQVLNFPLLETQYKQTLLILHKRIIPFCNNPTKLMDFLTDSYSIGFNNKRQDSIIISILALNGLFELMKNYNLEYPNFYENLYQILNNRLLHLNYKSRFFRMLDLFLSSTHLPSNLIASFIKKLSKLSLTAPPSGIVIVIPFIYNLLKKHPTCMVLIHNTTTYTDYSDPFNNLEIDPLKTTLLESSLWELNTLMNHYHPNVASLAKIFSQPFNKYSYNLEDFLDWNYSNLLDSELSKRFKGDLSLEFEKFETLLHVVGKSVDDDDDDDDDKAYVDTWSW